MITPHMDSTNRSKHTANGKYSLAVFVATVSLAFNSPSLAEFAPKAGYFQGNLELEDVADEYIDSGPHDPGHTEFRLLKSYAFIDEQGREWRVPKNQVVNGASIPRAVWSWIGGPWSGKYRNATVIHDWMCEELIADSETAHRVFYEGLLAGGVSRRKAWIMYQSVLQGGPYWEADAFGPSDVRRPEFTDADLKSIIEEAERRGLED